MKTIYVVTSQYMPLVDVNANNQDERVLRNNRLIHTHDITEDLIEETFAKSKMNMLACITLQEAMTTMALVLKKNNTTPDFIDGKIPFFAVPVVFTVEVEDDVHPLKNGNDLTGATLFSYFETDSIPYFDAPNKHGFFTDSIISMMDKQINQLHSSPTVFTINKENISNKVQARYFATNPLREATVHLAIATEDLQRIKGEEAPPMRPSPKCSIF